MADIFISYQHSDREVVKPFAEALRKRWSVWWDPELRAGEHWSDAIEKELGSAALAIVLWSQHSVQSDWVMDEANRAKEQDKLFPVLIDNVEIPMGFGQIQATRLIGWSGAEDDPKFQELLGDLDRRLVSVKHALLIGAGVYQHAEALPEIRSAQANVTALQRILAKPDGAAFQVRTLQNPTERDLQKGAEDLVKMAGKRDLVLLYYCGYAKVSQAGEVFLCAADSEPGYYDSSTVASRWLTDRSINKTVAAHVVVLLDCIFSMAEDGEFKGDIAAILQQQLGQGRGKHLLTSSTKFGADIAKPGEATSLLAKWFKHGLETGEADDGDQVLTADEITRFVRDKIAVESPEMKPQTWGFNVSSGQGEILRLALDVEPRQPRVREDQGQFYGAVKSIFRQGAVIPFLGDGIYTSGPLSSFKLVAALSQEARLKGGFKVDERYPLATAAELLQVHHDSRSLFLGDFKRILGEQSGECGIIATHNLIFDMETPWLVISATYDWVLEGRLQKEGKPFAVIAHILDADDAADEGKLFVVRYPHTESPSIVLADKLTLTDLGEARDRVIYKLVGSPYLNELGKARCIDTVVVTESDHMTFLARLENEHTKVPQALSPVLKRRSLLFLGYNLDVWHYRLVAHIFSNAHGYGQSRVKVDHRYAVRTATSPMEERFWKQLVDDEDRLESDCDSFVRMVGSPT